MSFWVTLRTPAKLSEAETSFPPKRTHDIPCTSAFMVHVRSGRGCGADITWVEAAKTKEQRTARSNRLKRHDRVEKAAGRPRSRVAQAGAPTPGPPSPTAERKHDAGTAPDSSATDMDKEPQIHRDPMT